MTSWGRELTPNEPEWVGELIDAEIARRDSEIERLRSALDNVRVMIDSRASSADVWNFVDEAIHCGGSR